MQLQLASAQCFSGLDGSLVALAPRDAALLAWLALEGPTARARLAALLWPDSDAEAARNSLRQRLFQLRKQFGSDVIVGSGTLALAAGVEHDLTDSDSVLGDTPADNTEFGAWLAQQRTRRRGRMRKSLVDLAEMAEGAKDLGGALTHASELLALEPLSEDAHRRVIRLHYLYGDRAAALLAFDRCERMLKDEVGARPSAETLALLDTIEQSAAISVPAGAASTPHAVPASLSRPPRIVGRDAQWHALHEAWNAGHCVLVTGDGGMGKSRLVGDFAQSRGATLMASARPGDERVAYASFSRLLRALPQAALLALDAPVRSELARLLPELGASSALRDDQERTRFFNAVSATLDSPHLALEGIVFDDLHFADDASIELLQFVSAGSTRRWLVAARGAEVSVPGRNLLQDFMAQPDTVQLPLGPLALQQVAELLDSLGIEALHGNEHAAALLRHTGGNPLYVLETVKAWLTLGSTTLPSRLPAAVNIGSLIERRISCLSQAAVQLARCAAVAAPDFSIELASQVLGVRTLHLADPWRELEMAHVLQGDGAFVHDLIYESALASVPAAVARRLHAEIAEFLSAHDGEPARVAAHWLAAGQEAPALQALLRAADAAHAALRVREECSLLLRAAEIAERLGEHGAAFDALHRLFNAETAADRTQIDDALLERLQRCAQTPERQVQLALLRAENERHRGNFAECTRLSEVASDLARRAGLQEKAVEAVRLGASAAAHIGDGQGAVALLRPLLPWVLEHGADEVKAGFFNDLACCLDTADLPLEAQEFHRRSMELNAQPGKLEQAAQSAANLGTSYRNTGHLQRAYDQLQQALRFSLGFDQSQGMTWQTDMMAFALLRDLSRYDEAVRAGDVALHSAAQHPVVLHLLHGHFACLWLHLGQAARAQQSLAAADVDAAPPFFRARLHQLEGRLKFAMGHDAAPAWSRAQEFAPLAMDSLKRFAVALDHALTLPAKAALAQALEVQQRCEAIGYAGMALAARMRVARFALEAGDLPLAVKHAHLLVEASNEVEPDDFYRGELWLTAARALAAGGQHAASRRAASEGANWVRGVAQSHVPEEFRDSFLHRNPINRDLLALASQLSR